MRRRRSAWDGCDSCSVTCCPTSRRPSSWSRVSSSRRSSSPRRQSAFSDSACSRRRRRGAACSPRAATSSMSPGGSPRSPARPSHSRRSASICSATGCATPWTPSSGSEMSTSHFFAYLSRMKFIRRWGLMHSTYPENIQEHSLRVAQIPDTLKPAYEPFFRPEARDDAHRVLVRAADKICAYLKCLEETGAGNPEFAQAEKSLRASVEALDLPEVRYFLETFVPSFRLTL